MGSPATGEPGATVRVIAPDVEQVFLPDDHPMHLGGVAVYLVGRSRPWIVDTGNGRPGEEAVILAALGERAGRVRGIVLTHGHGDHAGGAATLASRLGVPVHASARTAWRGPAAPLSAGDALPCDEGAMLVMETPGHSDDSISLAGPGARWILSGDTVLGAGTSTIDRLGPYLESLDQLAAVHADALLPGHGPVITDPGRTLRAYRRHRDMRSRQILALLSSARAEADLLADVYPGLEPGLERAALRSLHAHLEWLQERGMVRQPAPSTWERT